MKRKTAFALLTCTALLCAGSATAQEFAKEVSQFVGDNARPFLQPLANALHANIHAGLLLPPPQQENALHVGVQLVAMAVAIPDEQKTFKPKPFSQTVEFTYNGIQFLGDLEIAPASLPTAAGLSRKATFSGRLKRVRPKGLPYKPGLYDFIQQDGSVTVGGYEDISTVIIGVPQVTVGSLYATDITIRYIPPISLPDVGDVKTFGIGARHSLARYVDLPVDLTLQMMFQSMTLTAQEREYRVNTDLSSFAFQTRASKTFHTGIAGISPYIGAGIETGSLKVDYIFADPYIGNQNVEFDEGARLRLVAGVSVSVWKVLLHADYNVALLNGFSVGFGVAF